MNEKFRTKENSSLTIGGAINIKKMGHGRPYSEENSQTPGEKFKDIY